MAEYKGPITVKIWGNDVGVVAWDDEIGLASFQYYPAFLKLGLDLSPLLMPINRANGVTFSFRELAYETYRGLPGLLADSLPDRYGNRILERWLAQQGRPRDSVTTMERLCYTGTRGMGALEFHPPKKIEVTSNPIDLEHLIKLVGDILDDRGEFQKNLNEIDDKSLLEIVKIGTSAGGARAKAVIAYNKKTGEIRSGQIDNLEGFEHWLIKLDGVTNKELGDPKGYGKIEYAYYKMATACGIKMTECRLKHEHDRSHFMTKRFDRQGSKKIHMLSLCGIAHFDYNQPRSYSYEQAFEVLRKLALPYSDSEQLYRRMCFNVIARNRDDHTKNISFLMDDSGIWRLSPAYDVSYAYNPEKKWTRAHQMTINEKSEDLKKDDLLKVALNMNIKNGSKIIEQISDTVSDWPDFAEKAGIGKTEFQAIHKFHTLMS